MVERMKSQDYQDRFDRGEEIMTIPSKKVTAHDIGTLYYGTKQGKFMLMLLVHIMRTTHTTRTMEQTIDDLYAKYHDLMFSVEDSYKK